MQIIADVGKISKPVDIVSLISGYHKPYRLDISDKQGGLSIYIKAHLPSKLLSNHISPKDIQAVPFELNLRKEKWMFGCIYRPPKQDSQYFLENLILTNRKYCFKHTSTFETGLSDHHHLIYSILKTTFKKEESKKFIFRDYKNSDNTNFQMDLESKLNNCPKKYGIFEKTFENVLNAHAPKKIKFLRGNQKPHVDKNLRKAIMKRSQLKNKANRTKNLEDITKYKKQRNLVVKLN